MKLYSQFKFADNIKRFTIGTCDVRKFGGESLPVRSKCSIGKFLAFTLAEVLIVLGIVGIVANMTIPTLIQNVQEKVFLTQFQDTYSLLQQAYIQVAQENGTADQWGIDGNAMYVMFRPFFKTIKDCPDGTCTITSGYYRGLSGINTGASFTYHMILANGSTVFFEVGGDGFPAAIVDLNGLKKPNQIGYDVFQFEFIKKNNAPLVSWPFYTSNGSSFVESSSDSCSKSSVDTTFWNGGACVYWVIKNGNMDYLHRSISGAEWIK